MNEDKIAEAIDRLTDFFKQRDYENQKKIDFVEEVDLQMVQEITSLKAELGDIKLLLKAVAEGDACLDYDEEANAISININEGINLNLSTNIKC